MTIDELTEYGAQWMRAEQNAVISKGLAFHESVNKAVVARQRFVDGLREIPPGAVAIALVNAQNAERRARELGSSSIWKNAPLP